MFEDVNIGIPVTLYLDPADRIVGTTYVWSQTGKRVTVWHEETDRSLSRAVAVEAPAEDAAAE